MNKEFLEKTIQLQLDNYNGESTLGALSNYLLKFIDVYIDSINTDIWFFQNYKSIDTDYLESKDEIFDFIVKNLESYFNFYINIEGENIEPCGVADIWISFEISEKSKELILTTLNKIKENLSDLIKLTDMSEIIDTRLPYYTDDFLDNIEIISSKVIMTK